MNKPVELPCKQTRMMCLRSAGSAKCSDKINGARTRLQGTHGSACHHPCIVQVSHLASHERLQRCKACAQRKPLTICTELRMTRTYTYMLRATNAARRTIARDTAAVAQLIAMSRPPGKRSFSVHHQGSTVACLTLACALTAADSW